MGTPPDISFVTVNYNGLEHTRALLNSLKVIEGLFTFEVIVVDNGSSENQAEILALEYPNHIVIRSDINLGFAGGNNIGIRRSSARYIMLINNDTIIPDGSLKELISFMDSNPQAGGVSPRIQFMTPPGSVQFAGYTQLTRITLRNSIVGYSETDKGQFMTVTETPYLHGAAMLVKREAIEKAGFMCEDYFLYYEELDWSMRLTESGYKLWYVPQALVIHKESMSTGNDTPLKRYYMTRNRLLFAKRNRKGTVRILSYIYQTAVACPKDILIALLRRRVDLAKAICTGVNDFMKM